MSADEVHDGGGPGDFVDEVLAIVESIPPGCVLTYGDVAELVGRGGPRAVGTVMSRYGSDVPWWRVVRASGHPVQGLEQRAVAAFKAEGTPLRGTRVVMAEARWAGPLSDHD